jgi:ribosomal protein S18 acetylase RimI-like enzyme
LLLIAINEGDKPVGFAAGYVVDGRRDVAETNVFPAYPRMGIGRRLTDALPQAGQSREMIGATLTTFRSAAFN